MIRKKLVYVLLLKRQQEKQYLFWTRKKMILYTIVFVLIPFKFTIAIENDVGIFCMNNVTKFQHHTTINDSDLNRKLDTTLPVYFVIHGWTESIRRQWVQKLMSNIILYKKINVCAVDWEKFAKDTFPNAVEKATLVGVYLAQFITYLQQQGVRNSSIHIISHSLGSQVSAVSGQVLNGEIGSIYGKFYKSQLNIHIKCANC